MYEVPAYWYRCHLDPTAEDFHGYHEVRTETFRVLERLLAGAAQLVSALRIENSTMWLDYEERKRSHYHQFMELAISIF